MAVTSKGIAMYDARDSIKVEAAETIPLGASVYIHTDGKAYVVDNGKSDVCHGFALMARTVGQMLTVVTRCRMWVNTAQTLGARCYTGAVAGGSAPSTTLAANGTVCGFAFSAYEIYVHANPVPPADG
jgi:hypothetical protein